MAILLINVIDSGKHPRIDRMYFLADTPLGKVVFYKFGEYTQYKNLTLKDIMWNVVKTSCFEETHAASPIEVFTSERMRGFAAKPLKINAEGVYHLTRKKKDDGYLYVIPATNLRAFTKKEYPDMEFIYARFHITACKALSYMDIERMYTREIEKFNGGLRYHSISTTSAIVDAVYLLLKEAN